MSHKTERIGLPTVGVIGSGYWGKNLVRNFAALGGLRAICDAETATLATFSATFPDVYTTQRYQDLLEDPTLDAVAIATPAVTHGEMVRAALLAGKDVFVEKPLCLSEVEGAELTALAARQERILMVGHLLWFHPAVLRLRALVEAGELGRILYIYSNRLNLGKLRREENVLWSFAPHDISIILGLLNEMPESVFAQGSFSLNKTIADTTVTTLSFASGAQAHLFVSWLHPFKEQRLVVVGDRQMAVFDDTAPWADKLVLYPHGIRWEGNQPVATRAEGQAVSLEEAEPLRAECQHFLTCVRDRQPPRTDGAEGVRVLSVLTHCQQSMKEGRIVSFAVDLPKNLPYFCHETAQVDAGAEIGKDARIWHFSHILPGVKLGERCNIGQNVVIGPNVTIGQGCKIQNNVSLYEGVTLEDEVFCGPSMVFTNVINPRAHIVRKHAYKPTLVRRGCTIGANATILCGVTLGRYSLIGAGSVVTRDTLDFALMVGNPARQIGWVCRCGETLPASLCCSACKSAYQLTGGIMQELPPTL